MKRGKYLTWDKTSKDCTVFGVHVDEHGNCLLVVQVDGNFLIDLVHYSRVTVDAPEIAEFIKKNEED